jgi:hypothetical protein
MNGKQVVQIVTTGLQVMLLKLVATAYGISGLWIAVKCGLLPEIKKCPRRIREQTWI